MILFAFKVTGKRRGKGRDGGGMEELRGGRELGEGRGKGDGVG